MSFLSNFIRISILTGTLIKSSRDHRVDALRGIALIMMYIDHIPENLLNRFTMRNVGFADAAEIFVLLAGYASWLAYGRRIPQDGLWNVCQKIFRRCIRLYIFQMGMVVITLISIYQWRRLWIVPPDFLEPELSHGYSVMRMIWRLLLLDALPSNLNILPLYIILLLIFPLIYLLMKQNKILGLGISALLWVIINCDPWLNFPNWLDPDGWYFNPLAWQFLFTLGVYSSIEAGKHGGNFPTHRPIQWIAIAYLFFSFLEAFPWQYWKLPDLRPFIVPMPEKAYLSPLRLLDVICIFYLVQSSIQARRFSESRIGQILALYGRHSLEVFAVSTIFDLWGHLMFVSWGGGWSLQVGVNAVGLYLLYRLALYLDKKRARLKAKNRKIYQR